MPDERKFAALKEIGYYIKPCCGICRYGEFDSLQHLWGRCGHLGATYLHGKHSGTMKLGVNRHGCCEDSFLLDESKSAPVLQSYSGLYREASDAEDLLKDAHCFQLEPKFHSDPLCPENDCWTCSSVMLPDDTPTAERTLQGALRTARRAIRRY